jgi:hypothetical protein
MSPVIHRIICVEYAPNRRSFPRNSQLTRNLAVYGEILAGATNGRKILEKLLVQTDKEPMNPEPVFLDFAGINVATASFLREAIVAYRNTLKASHGEACGIVQTVHIVARVAEISIC